MKKHQVDPVFPKLFKKPKQVMPNKEEMSINRRQKLIEEKLLISYGREIASIIDRLVEKNCNGCIIGHPSQRQHPCLIMEADERLELYFDQAIECVDETCEAVITEQFMKSLKDIKPIVKGLEILKYTCEDWRKVFFTRKREELINKIRELVW